MTVSVQSMRLRFGEFSELDDGPIQFAIDEAARQVDNSWMSADIIPAISYLAAHYLAVASSSADVGGRAITSESIGQISVSYAVGQAGSTTELKSTTYGERFLSLMRRNHPAVAII